MERAIRAPRARDVVFEALKTAAPQTFDDELRRAFLAGTSLKLAELDMDSLAKMEFCIAVELATGITLLPSQLSELASTDAIERRLCEAAVSLKAEE
ncbi:MAG TPA: hypothetical protein VFF44_13410 [Casimicrobiaceae bacterium]|nr:hypothetical protein [Casimicrobiaceae bacterium]